MSKVAGYTIPQLATDPAARASAINVTRAGFLYGPPLAGGPSFPTGDLGNAKIAFDVMAQQSEFVPNENLVNEAYIRAQASSAQVRDLLPSIAPTCH